MSPSDGIDYITYRAAWKFAETALSRGHSNQVVENALVSRGMDRESAVQMVSDVRSSPGDASAGSLEEHSDNLLEGLVTAALAVIAIVEAWRASNELLGPESGDFLTELTVGAALIVGALIGLRRRSNRKREESSLETQRRLVARSLARGEPVQLVEQSLVHRGIPRESALAMISDVQQERRPAWSRRAPPDFADRLFFSTLATLFAVCMLGFWVLTEREPFGIGGVESAATAIASVVAIFVLLSANRRREGRRYDDGVGTTSSDSPTAS